MEHFPLVDRLHTDVLEEKYGQINSKIVVHNEKIRKAHLIDSKGISRTFAITFLAKEEWSKELNDINKEISNGSPIGKAFRKYEYAIRKNVLEVYKQKIPNWLRREFRVKDNYAKARLSEFYAKKRNLKPVIYGLVVEIYSPDFRKPQINKIDNSQESALTPILEKHGFNKEEIWRRIGRENDYGDVLDEFNMAKKESQKDIEKLKRKIEKELQKESQKDIEKLKRKIEKELQKESQKDIEKLKRKIEKELQKETN